jgi:tetrahydromethanopterin S-methyltransferase subunit G
MKSGLTHLTGASMYDYIAESRADRVEMKAEMRAINQRMDAMNQRMDNTLASIHNLTTAAMAGIGAIAVAVVISLFK